MFQKDGIHLTQAGDRKAAELIYARLVEIHLAGEPIAHP
jgi:hypothetical protein